MDNSLFQSRKDAGNCIKQYNMQISEIYCFPNVYFVIHVNEYSNLSKCIIFVVFYDYVCFHRLANVGLW